jgi:hypothetical protein
MIIKYWYIVFLIFLYDDLTRLLDIVISNCLCLCWRNCAADEFGRIIEKFTLKFLLQKVYRLNSSLKNNMVISLFWISLVNIALSSTAGRKMMWAKWSVLAKWSVWAKWRWSCVWAKTHTNDRWRIWDILKDPNQKCTNKWI